MGAMKNIQLFYQVGSLAIIMARYWQLTLRMNREVGQNEIKNLVP